MKSHSVFRDMFQAASVSLGVRIAEFRRKYMNM